MVEWIPWLLIIIGWNADTPEDQEIITIAVAVDQEECESMGKNYFETDEATPPQDGLQFRYLCAPMPDREEFNAAVERWQSQLPERSPSE